MKLAKCISLDDSVVFLRDFFFTFQMSTFDTVFIFSKKIAFKLFEIYHNEEVFINFLSQFMIAAAVITFFSFTFLDVRAMYGRYYSESLFSNVK